MRTPAVALAIAASAALAPGQELVPNPSFEQAADCPGDHGQLALAEPWSAPTLGTSDYFNPCNTTPDSVGVPDNAVGSQAAFSGSSYAGFIALSPPLGDPDYREYLQAPLSAPGLEAGKTYRFSLQLSLAEDSSAATDRIGAHFSAAPVGSLDTLPLALVPQVESPAGAFFTDEVEWMPFSETFVAEGGELYLTIGNFHDGASSASIPAGSGPALPLHPGSGYYYVDVVSLVCEPCAEPPADLVAWWPLDELFGPLALDIAGAEHGIHADGPVPLPGFVDGALGFLASGVSVPSAPALELASGDFTLDAWVRPDALGTPQTLFSKIAAVDPATGPGYALRLEADGTLTFLMVDAALATVTASSSAALEPGQWSHVTVAVDRDVSTGGRIHVDGALALFDPTPAAGSLANPLPLRFARDGGAGVGGDLAGALDEVELFQRALSEPEVQTLYQARTSGKCKVYLDLPPVVPVPVTPPPLVVTGELTTSGDAPGTFTVSVYGEPAGTRAGLLVSTVAGPANPVVLTPQPIQVGPGASVPIELELDIPPGMQGGGIACYSVAATHLESGRTFLSRGALRGRNGGRRQSSPPAGSVQVTWP
jgi:hypothetical protein